MATQKQIEYAKDLAADLDGETLEDVVEEITGYTEDIEDCTVDEASEVIDSLLERLRGQREMRGFF